MNRSPQPGEPGYVRFQRDPQADAIIDEFAARFDRMGTPYARSSAGVVASMAADPNKFAIIGEMSRPGVRLALVRIELELFPPSAPLNAAFELCLLPWLGLPFAVALVPNNAVVRECMAPLIAECGLLLYDAVPILCETSTGVGIYGNSRPGQPGHLQLMRRGRIHWFPIHGDNAWSLETKVGSRIYAPDEETALCQAAWWEWDEKHGKHSGIIASTDASAPAAAPDTRPHPE